MGSGDNVLGIGGWKFASMHNSPARYDAGKLIKPRVTLVSMTPDPLGTMAAVVLLNMGVVMLDTAGITDHQRHNCWEAIHRTGYGNPLSFVQMHFVVENASTALTKEFRALPGISVVEENLDYAVQMNVDEDVLIPPTLPPQARIIWQQAVNKIDDAYSAMIHAGVHARDARSILPESLVGAIHLQLDLYALGHALASPSEEMVVLYGHFIAALRAVDCRPAAEGEVPAGRHNARDMDGVSKVWMSDVIADKLEEMLQAV
jgi:hypothetical protein